MKRKTGRSKEAIEFAKSPARHGERIAVYGFGSGFAIETMRGQKFRREFPIPPYTVDFCCVESRLVIEIDGAPHFTANGIIHDHVRDRFLQGQGL